MALALCGGNLSIKQTLLINIHKYNKITLYAHKIICQLCNKYCDACTQYNYNFYCFSSISTLIVGTINYMSPVSTRDFQVSDTYSEEPDPPASLAFLEAANAYIIEHNLQFPNSVQDAILLYVELVAFFESNMCE